MFRYIKQALAPNIEPELPPSYFKDINAARKLSFTSSSEASNPPEFDTLEVSAYELSEMLNSQVITSVEIVETYLHQIEQHNRRGRQLRALISVAPRHELIRMARKLDDERARGKRRGPLHGVPVVLKDNIMTDANLGMDTTVGTYKINPSNDSNADIRTIRLLRFRRVHTKEECHNRRPTVAKRFDNPRQSQHDRVLWLEEPVNASRLVSGRGSMPVAVCRTTHCKEEVALGTIRTGRFIDRIGRQRSFRLQHTRSWHRHNRIAYHTRESLSALRAETDRRRDTNGRHLLPFKDLRLRRRNGKIRQRFGGAHGRHDAPDKQGNGHQSPQHMFPDQGGLGEPENRVYRTDDLEVMA